MHLHELLCFGAVAGDGNPALVVEHGPTDPGLRQALATAHQRPATVFLDWPAPGQPRADYYYPHARSPLCLHASLAAAHVLLAASGETEVTLRTAMHGQPLRARRDDGHVFVALAPQAAPTPAIDSALARTLLGAPGLALASTPAIASVGSPKLLIEVANLDSLHALRPPLRQLVDWGRAHGVNGCYVYCRIGEQQYEGRNFNHLDPALEDAATGVAAGAMSVHLGHGLILHQGRASGRHCVLHTRIDGPAILVGGRTALS
jgi:PhzF family phenazine biosynthesis protein